jgi:hypothetical protein
MAILTPLYTLQTVSSTGPLSPVSVSSVNSDWSLCTECIALSPASQAVINFEESLTGFSTSRVLWTVVWNGALGNATGSYSAGTFDPSSAKQSLRAYQLEGTSYMGTAGAQLRANIVELTDNGAVTWSAWLET